MRALVSLISLGLLLISCFAQDAQPQPPEPGDQTMPPTAAVNPLLAEDIRDIKAEISIPEPHSWTSTAVLAAIVVALLAFATWYLLRRRHHPPMVDLLADALSELRATRELMRADSAEAFATSLSQVLRRYIEARFGARAAHQTTEEFLESLTQNADSPLKDHRVALRAFLTRCDIAKFAGMDLKQEEMDQLFQAAKAFLESTKVAATNGDEASASAVVLAANPQPLAKA